MAEVEDLLPKLQEFFAKDEMLNASSVLIPPTIKTLKDLHPSHFSIKELQPFHKDLRSVGYSLSYLDEMPDVLQTRVLKTKDAMFAQLTVGVHAIEVGLVSGCESRTFTGGQTVESACNWRRSSQW